MVNLVSWRRYVEPARHSVWSASDDTGLYSLFICALEQVFSIFEDLGMSVDCVATSEVSISVTLDPSKIWSRELIQQASASNVKQLCILLIELDCIPSYVK